MLTPEQAVLAAILICLAGALATLLAGNRHSLAGWITFGCVAGAALLIFGAVAHVLTHGAGQPAQFWAMPRFGFALRIYVDGLTAVFLALAALISLPAALYSIPYLRRYREYGARRYYPHFLLFLAAMYGLVSTTDMMWFFFIFWQLMTLPGYALIRFESREPANIRAANKYLAMMQLACAATMVGAELLAFAGAQATGAAQLKYDFDTVSRHLPVLLGSRPELAALAFGLFLVGFGIKMGMWPFGQVWLPDAHPAAPSPVSAMLSGVMIKTGVYGLLRYFLWLPSRETLDAFPIASWGLVISMLGTVTLFAGTMQALKQEQSKRLLAFHSIGQIGYILLGAGACMALLPAGGAGATLAALALLGALFHALNHGIFKALLFLNAGSMLHATGTQDLNQMGGLMRLMPVTALTALVASFAIAGVPCFNGFASKWCIYTACIQGVASAPYLACCGLIAILTSALTLASFVKFFGAAFLSRSGPAVTARAASGEKIEVGALMLGPQLLLAGLCLLLGLAPILGLGALLAALQASPQGLGLVLAQAVPLTGGLGAGVLGPEAKAIWSPPLFLALFVPALAGAAGLALLGGSNRRAAAPWLCGYARDHQVHRYPAHHLYLPLKRWFRWIGGTPPPPGRDHHHSA